MDEILKEVEGFRDLEPEALERLSAAVVQRSLPADHDIYRAGDQARAIYVVVNGGVVIVRDMVGRPVQLLDRFERGHLFGDLEIFDTEGTRTTTARTTSATLLLQINKPHLVDMLEGHPALALRMEMAAAKRHSAYAAAALELSGQVEVRIRVDQEAKVTLPDGRMLRVTVDNMSLGGLSLIGAPLQWRKEQDLAFQLEVPNVEPLQVAGRVAWLRGRKLGIAFTQTTPEHEKEVRAVLRQMLHLRKHG